jgi:hypothetical protein
MKAILEFDLPEDDVEFTNCRNASKYWRVLDELQSELRRERKYNDAEWAVRAEKLFYQICKDNDVVV